MRVPVTPTNARRGSAGAAAGRANKTRDPPTGTGRPIGVAGGPLNVGCFFFAPLLAYFR